MGLHSSAITRTLQAHTPMLTLATIAAVAVTGMLVFAARWMLGRFSGTRALRDVTVSRDWLSRHHAQDRS